jgi:hypothetical protein
VPLPSFHSDRGVGFAARSGHRSTRRSTGSLEGDGKDKGRLHREKERSFLGGTGRIEAASGHGLGPASFRPIAFARQTRGSAFLVQFCTTSLAAEATIPGPRGVRSGEVAEL